jgi:hypothetical protein
MTLNLWFNDGRPCSMTVSGHTSEEAVLRLLREMKARNPHRHVMVEVDGVSMHVKLADLAV